MSSLSTPHSKTHDTRERVRPAWTLTAVCLATFMLLLDITVINTALPDIQRHFHSSFTDLQWAVDAYSLTLAAFVLSWGSLSDRVGRRNVFIAGITLFVLASVACAASQSAAMLNICRAVQGVGGAAMFAVSLALLTVAFPDRNRSAAFAAYGATIGAAVALGPLIGGALTQAIGWPAVFLLNVPIGIIALVISTARVQESRDERAAGVDYAGTLLFSLGNALVVYALLRGNDDGWGSALIVAVLIAGFALLIGFVMVERRVQHPMLPFYLFRNRSFVGAQIVVFALSGSVFAMFLYITLYLQEILRLSPLQAGIRYLPFTGLAFLVAAVVGPLNQRVPARILLSFGLALVAGGLAWMSRAAGGDTWTVLLPGFLLGGTGAGIINPLLANLALSSAPARMGGVASGVNNTFRQVAIASGTAGLGAVFLAFAQSRIRAGIHGISGGQARDLANAVSSGGLGRRASPVVLHVAIAGFLHGFDTTLRISAALAALGAMLAVVVIRPEKAPVDDLVTDDAPQARAL